MNSQHLHAHPNEPVRRPSGDAARAHGPRETDSAALQAERMARLRRSLAMHLGDDLVEVVPYTEGSVCFTDAVRSRGTLTVVRSSKRAERRITSYDGLVDFRENVRKEVLVASLLAAGGVPVPRVLAWHAASAAFDEPSWMVSDFIAHTPITALTPAAQYQLGGITRAIHAITPTEANAAALTPGADWGRCIVERIMRRLERARRYIPLPPSAALEPLLEQAVSGRNPAATRLLHLDLRPPNLAVVDGRIVAIFDYANALCGDPYFELARIRECGLLTPAFVDGYGLTWDDVRRQEPLLCAYGLDLTTLLVIVTMEEFDDRGLHDAMARRTQELVGELLATAAVTS